MSAPNTLAEFNALLESARRHIHEADQPSSQEMVETLVRALEATMLSHLAMQKVAEVGRPLVPHRLSGKVVGWFFGGHTATTPVEAILGTGEI